MTLEPLTDYSRFKADCEKILAEFQSASFTTVTVRPATVCGYSARQRLDVVVNILTNRAYHLREITVFGGSQLRPNIHITDMVDAYLTILQASTANVAGEIFNVGYENQSVAELGQAVKEILGPDVRVIATPTDDKRSYHISSEKIQKRLGFKASHSIHEAIEDLVRAFDDGLLPDSLEDERYFNIKRMQSLDLK
jgi:nucleoside-diphosphate-sugar epimerase